MPSRYFVNHLADLGVGESAISRLNLTRQLYKKKTMETATLCVEKFPSTEQNIDGGLYVGISGLSYALWYVASKKTIFDQAERTQLLGEARRLITYNLSLLKQLKSRCCCGRFDRDSRGEEGGFLLGASGVYLTAALISREFNDEESVKKYFEKIKKLAGRAAENVNFLRHGSDEIFVGRAGYLCAILNWQLKLKQPSFDDGLIKSLISSIIESGHNYAKKHRSACPLMFAYHGTEYLGAAHGLTGILQMILSFPNVQLDEDQKKLVKGAVDWLVSVQFKSGNFPSSSDEVNDDGSDELVHWCHGAPGTIFLLARAYLLWKDDRYLQAALRCGDLVWQRGLLKKGPGICHGIAGNAYVFLTLYGMMGDNKDERQLHRALQFTDFMDTKEFKTDARTPDTPFSLFEGLAGTFCLYADLACGGDGSDKWEYPLMPVFF